MPASKKTHNLFVYGTLRPGTGPTARLSGEMYDCGWFPGVRLGGKGCNSSFVVECIEVDDARLARIDNYEGYHESNHLTSLYLRQPIEAVIGGKATRGWIYVYNKSIEPYPFVEHGDWLRYSNSKTGARTDLAGQSPKPKPTTTPDPVLDGERAAR